MLNHNWHYRLCSPPAADCALAVNCQFLPAYFPLLAKCFLEKGGSFVTPPIPYRAKGLFYAS